MFGYTEIRKRLRVALFGTAVRFNALAELPALRDQAAQPAVLDKSRASSEPVGWPGTLNRG
jgi:hypothetical protein